MIYLQVLDRYWDPGKRLLEGESPIIKKSFLRYMAREYVRLVILSIDSQRYISKWKDLTPSYLEYKRKHGLSLNIWEATGELKNSLKVLESNNSLVVGFDKRRVHKNSHIKLYKLARTLEYGNVRIPPRPLFRVVYTYMSSNVSYFWNKFLREEVLVN